MLCILRLSQTRKVAKNIESQQAPVEYLAKLPPLNGNLRGLDFCLNHLARHIRATYKVNALLFVFQMVRCYTVEIIADLN